MPYQQQVPAVHRALRALQCLAEARQPLSLAALSRTLGVAPSSLLAILNTLRASRLVARLEPDGRYTLGPGLLALGTAAAGRLDAAELFGSVAPRLAEEIGQAILQWLQHHDELVLAAVGLQPRADVEPSVGWEQSGPIEPPELDRFLRQGLVATLSYVADDGYPATVPLWYEWDGTAFWLAPRPGADWAEHVRRDPHVSLAVSESVPPLRRVLVRGQAEVMDDPRGAHWRRIEPSLAVRYAGVGADQHLASDRGKPRPLIRLVPEQLIAWRGLLRHPHKPASPHTQKDSA